MNYKVGDEVVCIDNTPVVNKLPFVRLGGKYVVSAMYFCCPKAGWLISVEGGRQEYLCPYCGGETGENFSWRFIKLDGLKNEHEQEEEATA